MKPPQLLYISVSDKRCFQKTNFHVKDIVHLSNYPSDNQRSLQYKLISLIMVDNVQTRIIYETNLVDKQLLIHNPTNELCQLVFQLQHDDVNISVLALQGSDIVDPENHLQVPKALKPIISKSVKKSNYNIITNDSKIRGRKRKNSIKLRRSIPDMHSDVLTESHSIKEFLPDISICDELFTDKSNSEDVRTNNLRPKYREGNLSENINTSQYSLPLNTLKFIRTAKLYSG